jgi:hypothetical protein
MQEGTYWEKEKESLVFVVFAVAASISIAGWDWSL